MTSPATDDAPLRGTLPKAPTGISGLDEVTGGGLPRGRPTLVCGAAGCGKTLFAMEFLVRGATQFGEPGVFFAFEETSAELTANVRSLGFDLDALQAEGRLAVEHIRIERSEIEEAGEFDLEGLFIRLGLAIDAVGAKRVVLDTLETLFAGFENESILRAELRRLFRWLKDRGVTAIITAERGDGTLTRQGLEEYVSDCVILLDHRVTEQVSTRRLRIVKYRGTAHGTNEYPFLIDESGFSVLPLTSAALDHAVSTERVPTGVARLDAMLGGGPYRGTSVLVSGTSGTGKTSLAAHMADAACRRGERVLYYSFEESPAQCVRNMRSIGLDLEPWLRAGLLRFVAARPTRYGIEMHLAVIHRQVASFDPSLVVIDPISGFSVTSATSDVTSMLTRLMDFLKGRGTTALLVDLTGGGAAYEATGQSISSVIDTWILLRDVELAGERNRVMYVLKSRGTAHSNQLREFLITPRGVELRDVYVGPEGVLTGSMRLSQEAREREERAAQAREIALQRTQLERKRRMLEARVAALREEFAAEAEALEARLFGEESVARAADDDRAAMAVSRRVDVASPRRNGKEAEG
ncbi:MAG: circadian clock protein KaiC [Polyangiales bacterium]